MPRGVRTLDRPVPKLSREERRIRREQRMTTCPSCRKKIRVKEADENHGVCSPCFDDSVQDYWEAQDERP